ncbi:MAG: MBOAT family protein [Lachnospiraceae bacterium]|nr:MBOAT family protein [Lachnospiraceae bacterium]
MQFNSLEFLIFFPIVALLYYVIPTKIRWVWLLLSSYYFYMAWNPRYAVLIAVSTLITYGGGLLISKVKSTGLKKLTVTLCVIANLGILFFFKYFTWILGNINTLFKLNAAPSFDIILPVGISFYTFQALSYTIDVYKGETTVEKNLFKYALFVSFFPQLVAGPIERSKNLLTQINETHKFDYQKVRDGLLIMMWGFFCKIAIADRCALTVNQVFDNYEEYAGLQILIAAVLFSIEIYCDFMGYSLIALGAAKVLGFNLMKNFEQPYFAGSIKEFWRRWHISLSTWFRDYLYIPLGGSRCSKVRKYLNLLIVFSVSGLWHGAGWNYVIWGLLHGFYQVVSDVLIPIKRKIKDLFKVNTQIFSYRVIKAIPTFLLITFSWIFFRSATLSDAINFIKRLFVPDIAFNLGILLTNDIYLLGLDSFNFNMLAVSVAILMAVGLIQERKGSLLELLNKQNIIFRYLCYWLIILIIVFSLNLSTQEFIYFQF